MKTRSSVSILTVLAIVGVGCAAPTQADGGPSQLQGVIDGACDNLARQSALQEALEYERSLETTMWSEDLRSTSGEIIVQRTYEERGQFCREYIDRCLDGNTEYVTSAKACRVGLENWQIVEVFFSDVNDKLVRQQGPTTTAQTTARSDTARLSTDASRKLLPAPAPAPAPQPGAQIPYFDVAEVQRALVVLGYAPGSVDGRMGPKTDAAIAAFARAKDIRGTWRNNPDLPAAIVREAKSVKNQSTHTALIGYEDPYPYKKLGEGFHAPLGYDNIETQPGVYLVSFYGGGGGWQGPSAARTTENMLTRALEICTEQRRDGYELLQSSTGELITLGTWRTSLGGGLPLASAYVSCCDVPGDGSCMRSVASAAAHIPNETSSSDAVSTTVSRR